MKKLLGMMLLCATCVFVLSSCSKEEEFAYSLSSIYGTWDGIAVKVDGQWTDITSEWYEDLQFSITFYDDGTYYGKGYFGTGHGTYEAKGDYIYTYVNDEPYYNYRIISLKDNIAELEMFADGSSSTLDIKVKKR